MNVLQEISMLNYAQVFVELIAFITFFIASLRLNSNVKKFNKEMRQHCKEENNMIRAIGRMMKEKNE